MQADQDREQLQQQVKHLDAQVFELSKQLMTMQRITALRAKEGLHDQPAGVRWQLTKVRKSSAAAPVRQPDTYAERGECQLTGDICSCRL